MSQIDDHVTKLVDAGIIEPSDSVWRSPLVVVRKTDGQIRMCTDFRKLNSLTQKQKFPMPVARSLFLIMASKKPSLYSRMDLLAGFYQCEIEESSRKYTAFEAPFQGVLQYRKIPMGLVGAPWAFSKVMALALKGLVPSVCVSYMDDILAFDADFETHLCSVELILQALSRAGLKVKPEKCDWCKSEIEFLGHVVSKDGIHTQKKILDKVDHFQRPRNIRTVRAFLGLCSYYRAFIPRFAQLAIPLYQLLKKNVKFKWTDREEQAFITIKKALVSPPWLIHPDFTDTFYLLTDSSDKACGAALCHRVDGVCTDQFGSGEAP